MNGKPAISPSAIATGRAAPNFAGLTPGPRVASFCLVALTVIALLLRVFHLTSKSFTLDEGFSIFLARASFTEFARWVWHSELNMALYYAALRLWLHVGVGEFVIRMLSVMFGAATVVVMYFLGQRLFSRRVGMVAALLMAMHPAHVALSQDARSYSLTVLLVSLSSLLFLRILYQPSALHWSGYAVVTTLAVYSHFFALLVVLAQALALLFAGPNKRVWNILLKATALLALLLVPLAIFLGHASHEALAWVPPLSTWQLLDLLYFLTLSKFRCLTYVLLWIAAIWAAVAQRADRVSTCSYGFVLAWLIVPIAVTIMASAFRPMLAGRFLAICIPASVLLSAVGFDYLLQHYRTVAAVTLLLLVLYSARSIRFWYLHPEINDDWRGATRYILTHAHAGDEVFVLPEYARFTVDYYRDISGPDAQSVQISTAAASTALSSLPEIVWFMSSDFPKPGTGDAIVDAFSHARGEYCGELSARVTTVKVWQFRRCHEP
jgi:4-amino-4-deoxy-L-arabinose transferase-like glycosyltransferase